MDLVLVLSQVSGLSNKAILSIANNCGQKEYYPGMLDNLIDEQDLRYALKKASEIEQLCIKQGIQIISIYNPNYPLRFLNKDDAPILIYAKGNIEKINNPSIAIIGSRNASEWSKKISECLGRVLGRDYNIVSGLAEGCDACAHMGCLTTNGYTIAVLPSGINHIYPSRHTQLANRIVQEGGCLISEYAPNVIAQKKYFVERDRLEAMLSDGVIVVEAQVKSGTMHTVNYARRYGRRIGCYTVKNKNAIPPGNQNLLDKQIATPIQNNDDLYAFKLSLRVNQKNSERQLSLFQNQY